MEEKLSPLNKFFTLFLIDDLETYTYLSYLENKFLGYFTFNKNRQLKIAHLIQSKDKFYFFINLTELENIPLLLTNKLFEVICIENILDFIENRSKLYRLLTKLYIISKLNNTKIIFIIKRNSPNLQQYYDVFKKFEIEEIKIK